MQTFDIISAHTLQSADPSRIQVALTLESCANLTAFVGNSGISVSSNWIRNYFRHSNPTVGGFEVLKMLNTLGMVIDIHLQCTLPFSSAVSPTLLFGPAGQLMYLAKPAPLSSQLSGHTRDHVSRPLTTQAAEQMCIFWIIDADEPHASTAEKSQSPVSGSGGFH